MKEIRLVGCVLPDRESVSRLYLVHRRDHNQWQFPGGEIEVGGESPETPGEAAVRHLEGKVGLRTSVENVRFLGHIAAILGDVRYEADMVALHRPAGEPVLSEWGQYNDYGYFNILAYGIGRHSISPVVEEFSRQAQNGMIPLW